MSILFSIKLHSSELHLNLISSQMEDEMQDFPIVQQTVGSAVFYCLIASNSSKLLLQAGEQKDNQGNTFKHLPRYNSYSISSRWEATRVNDAQNMCSAAMLCCSCTTDPSC